MFGKLEVLQAAQAMARHASARQAHVARNIANADTPGYRATDLPPFEQAYRGQSGHLRLTRAGHIDTTEAQRAFDRPGEQSPNGNTVSLEIEMLNAADIRGSHNRALAIYGKSLDILRASLGRKG